MTVLMAHGVGHPICMCELGAVPPGDWEVTVWSWRIEDDRETTMIEVPRIWWGWADGHNLDWRNYPAMQPKSQGIPFQVSLPSMTLVRLAVNNFDPAYRYRGELRMERHD